MIDKNEYTVSVTKHFSFCAGHRLPPSYKGQCRFPHGHNYNVQVTISGKGSCLDANGMLMDFGRMKELYKGWVDKYLDHAFLISDGTPNPFAEGVPGRMFKMPRGLETTVECIGMLLLSAFRDITSLENAGLVVSSVRVSETDTSWVEVR